MGTTVGIWHGHVLYYHIIPASLSWVQRNALQPSHPLRRVLSFNSGDSNLQFLDDLNRSAHASIYVTPTVAYTLDHVLKLNAKQGMPTGADGTPLTFPADFEPFVHVKLNDLADDFRADFAAFPAVRVQQELW